MIPQVRVQLERFLLLLHYLLYTYASLMNEWATLIFSIHHCVTGIIIGNQPEVVGMHSIGIELCCVCQRRAFHSLTCTMQSRSKLSWPSTHFFPSQTMENTIKELWLCETHKKDSTLFLSIVCTCAVHNFSFHYTLQS